MNVEITARHARAGKQIKEHARERIEQVLRHADGITSVHCILDAAKGRHLAEMVVHGRGLAAAVRAESDDAWSAIDACSEKLRHQLEHRAGKKRVKSRRGDKLSQVDAEMAARALLAAEAEAAVEAEAPRVIRGKAKKARSLSLAEARAELDDSKAEHLLYRDAKSDRVFVLYRRRDGQIGLIDTGVE